MKLTEKIFVCTLFILLIGELLVASYTISNNEPIFEITDYSSTEVNGNQQLSISYSLTQPTYPMDIRVSIIPILQEHADKSVYIYYDENYPSSLVTRGNWIGFIDHLLPALELKHYEGSVETVNASSLRDVMLNQYDSIVIIPSGVFPDTVHTKTDSIVGNFLKSGGTIIWLGDTFAYYSGKYHGELVPSSDENPGWAGQDAILGYQLSGNHPLSIAYQSSPISEVLNLQYPAIQTYVNVSQALAHGGQILGKVHEDTASIASVPVEDGFLVIFGGPAGLTLSGSGEDTVANDVSNILLSNIIYSNGSVSCKTIYRENVEQETLTLVVPNDMYEGFYVVTQSIDAYSYFFQRTYLLIK